MGNNLGIHIPQILLDALEIHENDKVQLIQTGESITIRKIAAVPHQPLEERLATFYSVPVEQIPLTGIHEFDWGKPKGNEVW